MPDLESSSVLSWLRVQEPGLPSLLEEPVRPAEAHPDVEAALIRLGEALDTAIVQDPAKLAAALRTDPVRDELRTVLGQLGTPRMLRLLGWIVQAGLPESDAVLGAVLTPEPAGNGQFLQAALAGAVQPPLLERLYAPDRLAMLLNACQPSIDLREAA